MRSKRSRTPYPSVPSMPLIPSRSARSWSKARCRSPRCSGSEVSTIYQGGALRATEEPRSSRCRGEGSSRSRAGNEVRHYEDGACSRAGVRVARQDPGGPVSHAGSEDAARGAECDPVRAAQCTAARCAHSTRVDRPRFLGSLVRRLEEGATGGRSVAFPHTWLLAVGWRRHGLLGPSEVPGGARASPAQERCQRRGDVPQALRCHGRIMRQTSRSA